MDVTADESIAAALLAGPRHEELTGKKKEILSAGE